MTLPILMSLFNYDPVTESSDERLIFIETLLIELHPGRVPFESDLASNAFLFQKFMIVFEVLKSLVLCTDVFMTSPFRR